jgi:pimeloyl-ACP methyl ester carboxylesterase
LNYSDREAVVEFRRPFLSTRYEELTTILRTIRSAQQCQQHQQHPGPQTKDVALLGGHEQSVALGVLSLADMQRTVLVGHSFGAAATVRAMELLAGEKGGGAAAAAEASAGAKVVGVIAMDLWAYPLPDHTLAHPIQAPSLFITSQQFEQNDEFHLTKKLISSCGGRASLVAIHGSRHQFVSDTPFFFPKPISDLLSITGRDESARTTSAAVADLLSGFIAQASNDTFSDTLWKKKLTELAQEKHVGVIHVRGAQ